MDLNYEISPVALATGVTSQSRPRDAQAPLDAYAAKWRIKKQD